MRLLRKLVLKLVMMIIVIGLVGAAMRFARPQVLGTGGTPGAEALAGAKFSSEESDLMASFFKGALRFLTGSAKREDVANEISDKLYGGRPGAANMAELGIELERPGAAPAATTGPANPATAPTTAKAASGSPSPAPPGTNATTRKANATTGATPAATTETKTAPGAFLGRLLDHAHANPELSFAPIIMIGMFAVHFLRRRRSPPDDFVMPDFSKVLESESGSYAMRHPVHALSPEYFELLVALIYQRQGYRVTMPAGLSGGRNGDFTLQRKSERILVQCKKVNPSDNISVERVRGLHESALAAGVTRGMYVANGNFSWDARNFAKTKGMTVINGRMLDELITAALTDEDMLAIGQWAPKLMSKVKLTPPICPACEASMDEISASAGNYWVCSHRPDCRGRRPARKSQFPASVTAPGAGVIARPASASSDETASEPDAVRGGRARTICPTTA